MDDPASSGVPVTIFWLLAVWVVLVLAALVWGVDNAEAKLRAETAQLLDTSGLNLTFDLSGRDVTLYGTVESEDAITDILARVDGLPGVRLVNDSVTVIPPPAPETISPAISMQMVGDAVSLRGFVPSVDLADALVASAQEQFGVDHVVNALTVDDNVESQPWLGRVRDIFAPLSDLRSGGFDASIEGIAITGEVASETIKERIEQDIGLIFADLLSIESNIEIAVLPAPTFHAESADDVVTLMGSVPDAATADSIVDAARRLHPGSTIINNLHIAEVAGPAWLGTIPGLLDVVTRLEPWVIDLANGQVTITGLTAEQDQVDAIGVLAGEVVAGQLGVVTDIQIDPTALATRLTQLLAGSTTFGSNDATISAEGQELLDQAIEILVSNPGVQLVVEGHTDDQGDEETNRVLSQQRADAVVAYLIAGGVDPTRLTAIGYGETRPIADNVTAEGRAQNRRIEFVIVEGDG